MGEWSPYILVVGKMGAGKSFVCNILLGEDKFRSAASKNQLTNKVETSRSIYQLKDCTNLFVADTPDFQTSVGESEVRNIQKKFKFKNTFLVYVANWNHVLADLLGYFDFVDIRLRAVRLGPHGERNERFCGSVAVLTHVPTDAHICVSNDQMYIDLQSRFNGKVETISSNISLTDANRSNIAQRIVQHLDLSFVEPNLENPLDYKECKQASRPKDVRDKKNAETQSSETAFSNHYSTWEDASDPRRNTERQEQPSGNTNRTIGSAYARASENPNFTLENTPAPRRKAEKQEQPGVYNNGTPDSTQKYESAQPPGAYANSASTLENTLRPRRNAESQQFPNASANHDSTLENAPTPVQNAEFQQPSGGKYNLVYANTTSTSDNTPRNTRDAEPEQLPGASVNPASTLENKQDHIQNDEPEQPPGASVNPASTLENTLDHTQNDEPKQPPGASVNPASTLENTLDHTQNDEPKQPPGASVNPASTLENTLDHTQNDEPKQPPGASVNPASTLENTLDHTQNDEPKQPPGASVNPASTLENKLDHTQNDEPEQPSGASTNNPNPALEKTQGPRRNTEPQQLLGVYEKAKAWWNLPAQARMEPTTQPRTQARMEPKTQPRTSVPDSRPKTVPHSMSINDGDDVHFENTLNRGRAINSHVPVIAVGPRGVGKTSLIHYLIDKSIREGKQTKCIDVRRHWSKLYRNEEELVCRDMEKGYEEDLNLQNMANAMKSVIETLIEEDEEDDCEERHKRQCMANSSESVTGVRDIVYDEERVDSEEGQCEARAMKSVQDSEYDIHCGDCNEYDYKIDDDCVEYASDEFRQNKFELTMEKENVSLGDETSHILEQEHQVENIILNNRDEISDKLNDGLPISKENRDLRDKLSRKLDTEYMRKVQCKMESSHCNYLYVSYLDFVGDYAYYTMHQLFMRPNAVYLLILDLSEQLDALMKESESYKGDRGILRQTVTDCLKFWLTSIHMYATSNQRKPPKVLPPVIVICTHGEKFQSDEEKEKCRKEIWKHINRLPKAKGHVKDVKFVSNTSVQKTVFDDIRECILRYADKRAGFKREISAQWIYLEKMLLNRKLAGSKIMAFEEMESIDVNSIVPIGDSSKLRIFLEYQHEQGTIMYFDTDDLRDLVVLDTTLPMEFMQCLIQTSPFSSLSLQERLQEFGYQIEGLIDDAYIQECIKNAPEDVGNFIGHFIKIAQDFDVLQIFRLDGEGGRQYIIPGLLRTQPLENILQISQGWESSLEIAIAFNSPSPPVGYFYRLLSAAFGTWQIVKLPNKDGDEDLQLYHGYACFSLDENKLFRVHVYLKTKEIVIKGQYKSRNVNCVENYGVKVLEFLQKQTQEMPQAYGERQKARLIVRCPDHGTSISLEEFFRNKSVKCIKDEITHLISIKDILKYRRQTNSLRKWAENEDILNPVQTHQRSLYDCVDNTYFRDPSVNHRCHVCTLLLNLATTYMRRIFLTTSELSSTTESLLVIRKNLST